MTDWFYPAGTAAEGPWLLSVGAEGSPTELPGWVHTGIKVADLAVGAQLTLPAADEERIIVPLWGAFDVVASGQTYALRGRANVFSGPTDVCYIGKGQDVTITATGPGRVAVATAPASNQKPNRLVKAEEIAAEIRGTGNCSREVHNFGTVANLDADRFIVCEVITPAGNWSSYPPHKHDEITETENSLEEIYYFETGEVQGAPEAAQPIGYARVYSTDPARPIDVTAEVRSGDALFVPHGWHGPAAAAPGYNMYYLNVMAGPGDREWVVTNDPCHSWIPQSMADQPIDTRLPLSL
ncbi:5-deoxy-glucuronate isomerase [Tessaracoccus sp. Z1128]